MSTGDSDLIDEHVSAAQCKKAVAALRNHAIKTLKKREETELLPGKEEYIWLILTVKKTHLEMTLKPYKIPVVHPLIDPRTTPICLITKDPQREYKDLLESHGIKFISRVVGMTKLKGKFRPFEARRLLLKENGLFLADERIVPFLPGLLGQTFFKAKKQPLPVCLTRKDLKGELERAVSSTYMHQNHGTCTSIKIGLVSQSSKQIDENLKSALPAIVKKIKGGWDNIQGLNVKTNSSISLPIWSCDLGNGEGARWEERLEGEDGGQEWTGIGGSSECGTEDEDDIEKLGGQSAQLTAKSSKGKKRDAEVESEAPSKKVKKTAKAARSMQNKDSNDSTPKGSPAKGVHVSKAQKSESAAKPTPSIFTGASKLSSTSVDPLTKRSKKEKHHIPTTPDKPAEKLESRTVPEDSEPVTPVGIKGKKKANNNNSASPALDTAVKSTPKPNSLPKFKACSDGSSTPAKPASALRKEDFKMKRAASGIEKKKEKVTKGKTGKGAKETIVGKAVKARP